MIRRLFSTMGAILVLAGQANASATRSIDADALKSSDHSVTHTLPGATGTLLSSATIVQESPAGSGTSFTLTYAPLANAAVMLFVNGLMQTQGAGKDYTISGTAITMASALDSTQVVWAVYWK